MSRNRNNKYGLNRFSGGDEQADDDYDPPGPELEVRGLLTYEGLGDGQSRQQHMTQISTRIPIKCNRDLGGGGFMAVSPLPGGAGGVFTPP